MALTFVKNARLTRVFGGSNQGAEFVETFTKQDGTEGETKYTAWFEGPHGLSIGAVGEVSGLTGVKARIWTPDDGEPRALADIVLNGARFKASENNAGDTGPF